METEEENKRAPLDGLTHVYSTALNTAAERADDPRHKAAMEAKRDAFQAMVNGKADLVVDDPFTSNDPMPALPALKDGEWDLLSSDALVVFAASIVEDKLSPELAALAAGIPPVTMAEYIDVGFADLAAGQWTRKAVVARVAMRAQHAVIKAAVASIASNPFGWKNHAWILERTMPQYFSDKRAGKKENAANAAMEQLQRQLSGAMMRKDDAI